MGKSHPKSTFSFDFEGICHKISENPERHMGGYHSGRSGGRPTVESGLTLNLGTLLRKRIFRPAQNWQGSIVWTNSYTGEETATIGYEAYLGDDQGRVRLRYTTPQWNGERHASDYWVQLATTPQPFGGRRWWFLCPRIGDRVMKLHLPAGALTFASRRAYRLGYQSQRETSRDRALDRAFKVRRRLGSQDGIGDDIEKPKGMHWATFNREMTKVDAAETIVNGHTWAFLQKLEKQLDRG